ncbi:MAG: hypothetical protein WAN92_05550, partial [Herbaspirillum sp.]
ATIQSDAPGDVSPLAEAALKIGQSAVAKAGKAGAKMDKADEVTLVAVLDENRCELQAPVCHTK